MEILITGATGLVGSHLIPELLKKGHSLTAVTRDRSTASQILPKEVNVVEGNLSSAPLKENLQHIKAVIHLMGESVAGRWSSKKKEKIYNSRINSTKHLIQSFSKAPEIFISSSAIGIYGDRGEELLTEQSQSGNDFLAQVCRQWESEALNVLSRSQEKQCRALQLRTGLVLSARGGALKKMLPAFKLGLGGKLGNGQQWMSWIHIQDLVRLFCFALETSSLSGPINATTENPIRNVEFTKTLADALGRSVGPSVPALVLKATFGEAATLFLSSQKVVPEKLHHSGFQFEYPTLKKAVENIFQVTSN